MASLSAVPNASAEVVQTARARLDDKERAMKVSLYKTMPRSEMIQQLFETAVSIPGMQYKSEKSIKKMNNDFKYLMAAVEKEFSYKHPERETEQREFQLQRAAEFQKRIDDAKKKIPKDRPNDLKTNRIVEELEAEAALDVAENFNYKVRSDDGLTTIPKPKKPQTQLPAPLSQDDREALSLILEFSEEPVENETLQKMDQEIRHVVSRILHSTWFAMPEIPASGKERGSSVQRSPSPSSINLSISSRTASGKDRSSTSSQSSDRTSSPASSESDEEISLEHELKAIVK